MAANCRVATHLLLKCGEAKRITFNLNLFLKEYLLLCKVQVTHTGPLCQTFRNSQKRRVRLRDNFFFLTLWTCWKIFSKKRPYVCHILQYYPLFRLLSKQVQYFLQKGYECVVFEHPQE